MHVMLVETDAVTGATYFTLRDEAVARTVDAGECAMVDLNGYGEPVGVEFPFGQPQPGTQPWHELFDHFPTLKEAFPNYI